MAHGGYGRRDVAPYSDVDLMILHEPAAGGRVAPLAERLLRDVFDAGLVLGHSVRTPDQACRLACGEPTICTSLVESRLLAGSQPLFAQLHAPLPPPRAPPCPPADGRHSSKTGSKERHRYGETVFLLEPNVKRSRGALRDIQLIRWIGLVRYGTADPSELQALGVLGRGRSASDRAGRRVSAAAAQRIALPRPAAGRRARPGRAAPHRRAARLRAAGRPAAGRAVHARLLPPHRGREPRRRAVRGQGPVARPRWRGLATVLFGHRVEDGVHVGPAGILATRRGAASGCAAT